MKKEHEKSGVIRDNQGKFIKGVSGNTLGRPPENNEQKLRKKASKELIANYKEKLAQVLPQLSTVLISKALEGDIQAIKELHDRVMGKAQQAVISDNDFIPTQIILRYMDKNKE